MKKIVILIAILAMGLYTNTAFALTSDTVAVSATVAAGTNSVAITETTIAFGTVTPTEFERRFSAGPMTVTYFAANSPWTIRTYTDNSPGNGAEPEKSGLEGQEPAGETYIPLKIWNANFGGAGTPPHPEINANWEGLNPVWFRIPEADEHTTNPTTWRRLAYTGAELPPSGFANYLGIHAAGSKAQAYATVLTVEIINQ